MEGEIDEKGKIRQTDGKVKKEEKRKEKCLLAPHWPK